MNTENGRNSPSGPFFFLREEFAARQCGLLAIAPRAAGDEQSILGIATLSAGTPHGTHQPSPRVEDAFGIRDYLLRVGLHVLSHPRRGARGSTISSGGPAVLYRGHRSLRLDARARRTFTERPSVGLRIVARRADFRWRLRFAVLGRTARSFRPRRG